MILMKQFLVKKKDEPNSAETNVNSNDTNNTNNISSDNLNVENVGLN